MKAPPIDITALECSEEEYQEAREWTERHAPKVLPPHWRRMHRAFPEGHPLNELAAYEHHGGLIVLLSCGRWEGKMWLHVSVTAPRRVPYYSELCDVKRLFIGRDRQAIQLFPPEAKHINIHSFCLHLWCCLEPQGDGLPDFGKAGAI